MPSGLSASVMQLAARHASLHAARAGLVALGTLGACATATSSSVSGSLPAAQTPAAASPASPVALHMGTYHLFVASESVDRVALVRFDADGLRIERSATVGMRPTDVDGPHGVAVSPDGRFYYVTTAHGSPFGYLWKFSTATDSLAGRLTLGDFPATLQITPDGAFAYVVNFNLHGEMAPSSVSVVLTDEMIEVARIATCTMPHGSRINGVGTKQYSACMMDDMAVEIDTRALAVSRHFLLTKGKERGMQGAPPKRGVPAPGPAHDMSGHGMTPPAPGDVSCSPTWVQPAADGSRVFVACNKSSDIVEIDAAQWTMTRRIPAGDGVYNLAITRDGRSLVATNKRGKSVSVIDIATGAERARIPTARRVVHGVAISTDDRYAFVSQEGIGAEPGAVDVIDLRALKNVGTIDVGQQAGGIDFWKVTPSR